MDPNLAAPSRPRAAGQQRVGSGAAQGFIWTRCRYGGSSCGAAAVLIIVRALAPGSALLRYAADLRLDALGEVHTAEELTTALEAGASIIGVNSRDLDTFEIDMRTAGVSSPRSRRMHRRRGEWDGGTQEVRRAAEGG